MNFDRNHPEGRKNLRELNLAVCDCGEQQCVLARPVATLALAQCDALISVNEKERGTLTADALPGHDLEKAELQKARAVVARAIAGTDEYDQLMKQARIATIDDDLEGAALIFKKAQFCIPHLSINAMAEQIQALYAKKMSPPPPADPPSGAGPETPPPPASPV